MLFIFFWFAHGSCEKITIMSVKLPCKGSQLFKLVMQVQGLKKAVVSLQKNKFGEGGMPGGALTQ